MVEWGHWPLPGTGALSDDERITGAENTILEATRYDRVKANATSDDSFLGFAPDTPGRLLVQPFTRPLKERLITLGLTDTIYYTTVEGETAVRRTAYSQIFDYLERYRGSEHINIHLIGHSQGATIAYDLLFGLFADAAAYGGNPPGYYSQASNDTERERFDYWRKRAQSGTLILGSFATFGSQLALMTMRKQRTVDSLANGYRLDPAVIGIEPTSVATKWKHFYDQDDVLGYPVRHLFNSLPGTFKEYEVDSNWNPLDSHSDYWICPQVQHEVATMIEANL
jgi:hypothetical protein